MSSIQSLVEENKWHLAKDLAEDQLVMTVADVADLLSKQREEMVNILKKELYKVNIDFETIKHETLRQAIIALLLQSNK